MIENKYDLFASHSPSSGASRSPESKSVSDPASVTSSAEETQALLEEYARTGELELRNRLALMHDAMVYHIARRFVGSRGASLEDLLQVAYMGLIAAIERFDPDRGIHFSTFAAPTIMGVIKRHLRDNTWGVKASRRLRELGLSLRKHREQLEQKLGRAPTVAEMAEAAGVEEERLLQAMDLERAYQPVSLDAHIQHDEGEEPPSFMDAFGALDPGLAAVERREVLREALDRLDERQREIIYARYFEEISQGELARRLGISQMHVSRLERQAIRFLRSVLGGERAE